MRALVTGAQGFVAPYLIRHLIREGDEVLGVGRRPLEGASMALREYQVVDLLKQEQFVSVLEQFSPDVVFHLAGLSFVPQAEAHFDQALRANIEAPANVPKSVEQYLASPKSAGRSITVLLASSGEVYGKVTSKELPLTEDRELNPANNYALTKVMMELLVKRYRSSRLKIVVARPFNHIGAGQSENFVTSNFAKQLAEINLGRLKPELNVGNLSAERDFTGVLDIVKAYRLLVKQSDGIFNICSAVPVSIDFVLRKLIDIASVDVEIVPDPSRMRPSDNPTVFGSYDKLKQATGWGPQITLEQSLQEIFEFWMKKLQRSS